jgi:hypothetical protein
LLSQSFRNVTQRGALARAVDSFERDQAGLHRDRPFLRFQLIPSNL